MLCLDRQRTHGRRALVAQRTLRLQRRDPAARRELLVHAGGKRFTAGMNLQFVSNGAKWPPFSWALRKFELNPQPHSRRPSGHIKAQPRYARMEPVREQCSSALSYSRKGA